MIVAQEQRPSNYLFEDSRRFLLTMLTYEVDLSITIGVRPQPPLWTVVSGTIFISTRQIPKWHSYVISIYPLPIRSILWISHCSHPVLTIRIAPAVKTKIISWHSRKLVSFGINFPITCVFSTTPSWWNPAVLGYFRQLMYLRDFCRKLMHLSGSEVADCRKYNICHCKWLCFQEVDLETADIFLLAEPISSSKN